MFYTIYETTNNVTNKKYIGKHITDNPNDAYLGSGIVLNKAIKKYGRTAFTKKVLFIFDNEEDMNNKEREIVTIDLIKNPNYYNASLGGKGGLIILYKTNPKYELVCNKISEAHKQHSKEFSQRAKEMHSKKLIGMYGRKHTDETKHRMSEKGKLRDQSHKKGLCFLTEKGREKLRNNRLGKSLSEETKSLISLHSRSQKGVNNAMFGKHHTEEAKRKIGKTARNRPKFICEFCSKEVDSANYIRWHGNNCRIIARHAYEKNNLS